MPAHGRRGIFLLALAAVGMGVTYTNHAPVIPLLAEEFALSDVESGLLTTALFLASVITYVGGGNVGELLGAKRMVTVGMGTMLVANVFFAAAPSYWALLLAKAATGLGSGIAFNASQSYLAGLYGERRSHFGQGLFGAGFPLGAALAIWAMPALALAFEWRGAFLVSSGFIGWTLALWAFAPRVRARRAAGTFAEALGCGNCWWTALQHAAGFGLALAVGTWIAVYLVREYRLSLETSGLLGSGLLLVTVLARTFGGLALSRRVITTRGLMRLSQLATLAGVATLAYPARPLPAALAATLLIGFGTGLPYAAVFNTAAASLATAPGAAQGLAAFGGTAGALVGAPAMGYAVQTWGFAAAWLVVGAVSVAALGATYLMRGEEELVQR